MLSSPSVTAQLIRKVVDDAAPGADTGRSSAATARWAT
jgi:hypothetical protein